jgi:ABC-type bacteriocin/lantibiotic exporter with double-glycine peptidase domain
MKRIPFYSQKNDYYCGPATLQMTLGAFGITSSQDALAKAAKTNKKVGTSAINLVRVLRAHKLRVRAGNKQTLARIKAALAGGEVVIICYTEPILEWGHYAVVRKVTDTRIHLLDSDARTGKTSLLIEEFKRRWKDPLFTKTVRWAAFVSAPKSARTA